MEATLKAIGTKAVAGKAFGAKATTLRKTQSGIVARRFSGETLHGVPFSQVYDDIECIDVKIEAGRASGAVVLRQAPVPPLQEPGPAKAAVTFGSALTGTAVALPAASHPRTRSSGPAR